MYPKKVILYSATFFFHSDMKMLVQELALAYTDAHAPTMPEDQLHVSPCKGELSNPTNSSPTTLMKVINAVVLDTIIMFVKSLTGLHLASRNYNSKGRKKIAAD